LLALGASPRSRVGRILTAVGVAALAAVCACARSSGPPAPASPVTLRVGIAQPAGSRAAEAAVEQVAELLRYSGLVGASRDGSIQPGIAERWTFSSDWRTLRLFVRPGLVFQDGSSLDAHAVARWLEAQRSEQYPGLLDITRVGVASHTEVVVEQRAPSSLLLEALALNTVVGGKDGDATAGPFRIVSRGQGLAVLEAFDRYYRGRPSIDRIELRAYPSARAAWVALMRNEIDSLYDAPAEAVEFVEASTQVRAYSFLRAFTYVLGFNLAHPALRDVRVRQALTLAVDRRAVIDHAFGGRGVPATGALWLRHWAYDSSLQPPMHDLSQARALMQTAGWLTPAKAGTVPPARLRLSCLVPAGIPVFERLALVLQRQLLDVDVDLVPEVLPVPQLIQRLRTGQFETFVFELAAGQGLNWAYAFWHSQETDTPWRFRNGYTSADGALDAVRRAVTPEQFRDAVHALQQVFVDDPPAIFLAWSEKARAVRLRFVVPPGPDRDVFTSIAQWRLAEEGDAR
jgi:peptide/nickel transport system substrate-binding protein